MLWKESFFMFYEYDPRVLRRNERRQIRYETDYSQVSGMKLVYILWTKAVLKKYQSNMEKMMVNIENFTLVLM